jgi:cytochrome b561
MLWNWRWWLGVLLAALLAVELPSRFFAAEPSGSVHAQIWHVALKLIATYLLAVGSWVLLLGWLAVLFGRQNPPAEEVLVAVPAPAEPPEPYKQASAKLDLPEGS